MQRDADADQRDAPPSGIRVVPRGICPTVSRGACLSAIVDDGAAGDVESLIVLDQDDTLIQFDRRLLYRSVHAIGREHDLHYQHRRSNAEQLLGIPDAFAWCWARGGQWRQLIRPAVTVKTI